jgi:hypothetical protein
MLSWVLSRFSRRPTISEAHCPDEGMTCITPMALATETCFWFQPDSCHPTASASLGSTPWRLAVALIMALVWLRLGTDRAARAARLRLAALTMLAG